MNIQSSGEKVEESSQPSFCQGERCGNGLAPEGTPALCPARWDSAPHLGPHTAQEAPLHALGTDGERISLADSRIKVLAREEAPRSVMLSEAPVGPWVSDRMGLMEPECSSSQAQQVPGDQRYDHGDANWTVGHDALHLEEGWEIKGGGQSMLTSPGTPNVSALQGSLPHPGLPRGQATAAPHHSEVCLRDEKSASEGLGIPSGATAQEPPCKVFNTMYLVKSKIVMQIDAPANAESPGSSGKMPGALTSGFQPEMTSAPRPGLQVLNGSYTSLMEKSFGLCEDRPNGETTLQTLCVPEVPPSGSCPEANCAVDRPPFSDPAEQLCQPGDRLNEMASPNGSMGIRSHPVGAPLVGSHPPDWEVAPSLGSLQEGSTSSPNDVGYCPPDIPGCPNETFSVLLPEKTKERPSEKEKNTQDLVKHPSRKVAPIKALKPALGKDLGKSAPKPGNPQGGNLCKPEKISFPRPNFKNVKAKVVSRRVLLPREPAAAATPRPRLPPGPPLAEPSWSSRPRRAGAKADILPSEGHRQHLLKLIASQVGQVRTHFRSSSQEVSRANHRGGRASRAKAGCLPGSGVAAMGPHKGSEAPNAPMKVVESAPSEPQAPASDGGSPERQKGEDGGIPVPLGTQEGHWEAPISPLVCSPMLASTPKTPPVAGRNGSRHDPLGLSKIPVPKTKVWPLVSCRRRSSTEARNVHTESAVSPQRARLVSSSGASRKSVSPRLVAVLSTVEKGKQRYSQTPCHHSQSSPNALSTEKTLGLASHRAKGEHQGKVILHLKQLLAGGNRKLEALAVVIQHLLAEREEAQKQHQALSQELFSLQGELVTASAACEKLEKARNELQTACQAFVDKLNVQHQAELAELESQLKAHYTGECERLQSVCVQEVQKYQAQLQSQVDDLNAAHEAFKLEVEANHSEQVDLLKKAYEASLTEIKECHDLEKTILEELFSEKRESLEKEIHDLKNKNDALNEKLQLEEQEAASREKLFLQKNPQIMYLERELESLKAVLEIKNEKLHQQDVKLLRMEKLVDSNTALVDKLNRVQQENEELKARMDKHMAISRQLSTEQAVLQESLEKESKVNKRLSMENEELLWKLHNGDLCSPKKSPPSSALPLSSPRSSASFPSPTGSPR